MLARPNPRPVPRWWILGAIAAGAFLAVIVASTLLHDPLFHRAIAAQDGGAAAEPGRPVLEEIDLSEAKAKAAGIEVVAAQMAEMATELDLPATLEPNADLRVEIRPRVLGVIREARAAIGQVVEAGEVLAILDSPDVGTARLDLRAKKLDLSLAKVESEWAATVARNVQDLVVALAKNLHAKELEKQFAERPLGSRRSELLGNLAELEIARHEEEVQADLYKRSLIGEHLKERAIHTREAAQAKFEASLEQVRYDAQQAMRRAEQATLRGEAAVLDATQRLRILGVDPSARSDEEDVIAFPIVAPFAGTITARSAVPSQRVDTTDVLYTLVDLTTVRARAHVPESAMAALAGLKPGDTLTIRAAAYPDRGFEGRLLSIGSEVDPRTRTVPLLAELPNPDGRLRPGMFGRILLRGAEAERSLTVPSASVVEIEGQPCVFVPGSAPNHFALRKVVAGRESDGRRAIASGLKAGDPVVGRGAFACKSELILRNEPEED
ncbi:MAG: efflux RND transporter periplasmic adaptor subunit [Isosphaeraceae bacterium]